MKMYILLYGAPSGSGPLVSVTSINYTLPDPCVVVPGFDDGRINPEGDGLTTAAIYCGDDDEVNVYAIDVETGLGNLVIHVTADELAGLPDNPTSNLLVASAGNLKLWKLTTGELELVAYPTAAGKTYTFIWNGCPYDRSSASDSS